MPWSDVGEWAGVILIAAALGFLHIALAIAVVGLYLVVSANLGGRR